VRFEDEWHDGDNSWVRSYCNELWEFDAEGLMRRREASTSDVAIAESERRYLAPRTEAERRTDFPLR